MTLEMRGGTVPTTRKREGEKEAEKKKKPQGYSRVQRDWSYMTGLSQTDVTETLFPSPALSP